MTYLAIPLMIAYLLFALGGWIMEPMSNTILNFDKYGKYLLDKSQKLSGYTFGGLLILSIASILVFYFFNTDYALTVAIAFLCALLPLPRAFLLGENKGKTFAMAYGVLILVVGLLGAFFTTNLNAGIAVFALMMLYTWIGNFIESK